MKNVGCGFEQCLNVHIVPTSPNISGSVLCRNREMMLGFDKDGFGIEAEGRR